MLRLAPILLAALAGAAGVDLDTLTANPPFGAGTAPKATATAAPAADLEFRGMYQDGGKTYFSLYNTTTKQSRWVPKEEAAADPTLPIFKSYDPQTGTLTIESAGRPVQVVMKSGTVAKYEPPPQPKPEAAAAVEPPRGGPPLPEPGPDGKVQTPWGSFTPEQIAAYRAERERRWQERMQQVQAEGGDPRRSPEAPRERDARGERTERTERTDRGGRPPR